MLYVYWLCMHQNGLCTAAFSKDVLNIFGVAAAAVAGQHGAQLVTAARRTVDSCYQLTRAVLQAQDRRLS